jgi:hypothetical protein
LINIGKLWLYKDEPDAPWVLNFPTKFHWKYPSKMEYIEKGLQKFVDTYKEKGITSIAFPLLGTHNGGLNKQEVLNLMQKYLGQCDIPIEIHEYDPYSPDDLFATFKQKWNAIPDKDKKKVTGIKTQPRIDTINAAVNSESVKSMIALIEYDGIGIKTMEHCFGLVMKQGNVHTVTKNNEIVFSIEEEKQFQIRNSTADFLIFTRQNGEDGIAVRIEDENVWLRAEAIAELFQKSRTTVVEHLKNIFETGELNENSVCRKFRQTAEDGKNYNVNFYSLEAIIAVGYRADSQRAIEFRKWATNVLSNFAKKGYVLDKNRLINDQVFSAQYFDELIAEIQEIRASERKFYQKITDIYQTAYDYNSQSPTTKEFFANVQNKLHYAIHQHTVAELIVERADATKQNMGLTSWKNAPHGKIIKTDVSIAKNYLSKLELEDLNEIVTMYLDYANRQAKKYIPMSMEDWKTKLDVFLQLNDEIISDGIGRISHEMAKAFAESEFEKYRVLQDKVYKSDFDKLIDNTKEIIDGNNKDD